MKKTLVALAVTAFAASASAFTAYENNGTTVDVSGDVRLILEKASSKTKEDSSTTKTKGHSNLKDNGSRLAVKVKHNIADDFYALGYYRADFGKDGEWSTLQTKRAFAGFGSKQFGQITFGNGTTIGDDVGRSGFDYKYGTGSIGGDILTASSKSMIRYDYTGIEGLTLSTDYRFANDRAEGEVKNGSAKSGFSLGAIYDLKLAENQALSLAAGYSHDSLATGVASKARKDGVVVGAAYTIDKLTLAADYGRGVVKGITLDDDNKFESVAKDAKTTQDWVRLGAKYAYADNASVYTNYGYGRVKEKGDDEATKAHQFMVGTDYKFHKQVLTFVEGRVSKTKAGDTTKTDKVIGVGLRVFF